MKLSVLAVGQIRGQKEAPLFETYATRISKTGRALALDGLGLTEIKDQAGANSKIEAALEAAPNAFVVALDERGKSLASRAFSEKLAHWRDDGTREVIFVLGAADGLSETIRQRANMLIALGPMTWPHILARVLLAEQIWRAISILANHPYHRD